MAEDVKTPAEIERQKMIDDPTYLPEGFFDQEDISQEAEFAKKYNIPNLGQHTKIDPDDVTETRTPEEIKVDAEKAALEEAKPFQFDESLEASEKEELTELNARLGSNYESLADLKAALNKTDSSDQLKGITEDKRYIEYYKDVLKYPSEKLVRDDAILKAQQKGEKTDTVEFKDSLDLQIEKMTDGAFLEYAADSLRNTIKAELLKLEGNITTFNTSQKETTEQANASRKEKLQEGINSFYKLETFMGVKVKKEELLGIYSDISKNKHINHLKANPIDAVKFAFFLKHEKVISELMNKPGYQAGVQKALNEMGMQTSETSTKTISNDKGGTEEELSSMERFIK